ncbi:hypothetical protein [Actinoplanes sp. NPDC026623]|uniref:hypothetical protein n=1 Tax=Actinoplanes sp. NPDC026623 TaxID=3155610 RepID=UPI0033E2F00B
MDWPLGQLVARAPAGSIEPGTVARAALALGGTETGRAEPPAEPVDAGGELTGTEAAPAGVAPPEADAHSAPGAGGGGGWYP